MITAIRGSAPGPEKQIPVASFESLMNDVAGPARSPLEDVIAAVTAPSEVLAGVEPNSPRFMVRVAKVDRPHRPTKRNYDYFAELEAALAARRESQSPPGQS